MSSINTFVEKIQSDPALQEKLEAALRNYSGEQSEEALFEGVFQPIASDAGISISFEDMKREIENQQNSGEDQSMDYDELAQVSGGGSEVNATPGIGAYSCESFGIGFGFSGDNEGGGSVCFLVGTGGHHTGLCLAMGATLQDDEPTRIVKNHPELFKRNSGPAFMD